MLEPSQLYFFCKFLQSIVLRDLLVDNIEPSQPLRLVFAGPQTRIAIPQSLHFPTRLPVGNRCFDGGSQGFGQGRLQSAHDLSFLHCASLNGGQQFVEGIRE